MEDDKRGEKVIEIIGVRFKRAGKVYYFSPGELDIKKGENVIVETVRGLEYGSVVLDRKKVKESEVVTPLKTVQRIADDNDRIKVDENIRLAKDAFELCSEKIREHKLEMKLVDSEYTFDNSKLLFYFTADGRIDFRELVKDLASVFKTRIELRQIGVRDETKTKCGIGICGRSLCCCTHLSEFAPVSIKMAKEQGLSLNPTKISGVCGRLMCCLKYEQDVYEEINERVPGVGSVVSTPLGNGTVIYASILKEKVKVKIEKQNDTEIIEFDAKNIKVVKKERQKTFVPELEEVVDEKELKQLED